MSRVKIKIYATRTIFNSSTITEICICFARGSFFSLIYIGLLGLTYQLKQNHLQSCPGGVAEDITFGNTCLNELNNPFAQFLIENFSDPFGILIPIFMGIPIALILSLISLATAFREQKMAVPSHSLRFPLIAFLLVLMFCIILPAVVMFIFNYIL